MKRILSLLLAISMMISLLPAVSAGETETEYTSPGITVKYDFSGYLDTAGTISGAEGFGGKGYPGITFDSSDGFFEYAAHKYNGKYSWDGADKYPDGSYVKFRRSSGSDRNGLQINASKEAWFALKIYVPKSGIYTPKATYWAFGNDSQTYLDYFLIKDDGTEISELLADENLTTENKGYVGSKLCVDLNKTSGQTFVFDEAFEKTVTLDEGKYYLVYRPRGTKTAVCSNFTLDGSPDGDDTKDPVPMMARLTSDSVRVFDGSGTAQLKMTLCMSDGSTKTATGAKFEVTEETSAFASVDKDTGVISGIAPGTAKFRASVTVDGKEFTAETSLSVVSGKIAGIKVKYDLSAVVSKLSAAGETLHGPESFGGKGYNVFTYDETNGFFEYAANKTKDIHSWDEGGYDYSVTIKRDVTKMRSFNGVYGLQFLSQYVTTEGVFNSWFALKIKVPRSGIYTPKVTYAKYDKDGETYLDYFLIKDDGTDMSELLSDENLTIQSEGYIGSKRSDEYVDGKGQSIVIDEAFEDEVNLDEGEYYLVYKPRVVVNATNWIGNYSFASSFTLDGGDTKEPVPMYTRVKADSAEIYAGGGITQVSADVYMSDGTVEKGDDVKLTSLTPDFASVNDIFSVVIGENVGTAKLSAVVTHKGVTLADAELTIPVVENPTKPGEGEKVVYDISSYLDSVSSLNGEDGLKYADITFDSTGGNWAYAGGKTNGKYNWADDGWKHTTYNVDKSKGGGGYTRFRQSAGSNRNGLQMLAKYDTWFALKIKVPYTGLYLPAATYWMYGGRGNGAESYMDYFLIEDDGSEITALLDDSKFTISNENYIGSKNSVDSSLSSGQTYIYDEPLENKIKINEGEYYLVYKPRNVSGSDNYVCASNFTLDGVNCVKDFYVDIKSDIDWNESTKISVLPVRLDGTAVSNGQYTVTYKSSKDIVATVSPDGTVKGVGEGTADITVTIDDGIGSITKTVPVTVTDNTGMNDIIFNLSEKLYVNQKVLLDIDAVMNSENVLDIPSEHISYNYSPAGVVTISSGILTALAEGEVTVTTEVDFRGKKITRVNKVTVVPDDGKTEPNIHTYKMRENALNNAAKYDWAKKMRDNAAKAADKVLPNLELLRAQIYGEGIPRGRQLGCKGDDYYSYCRYCHANIEGEYSWMRDYINRPWKIQCGACKRLFPSNDFESFLKLGLDESGLYFDVDRARQAHHEMLFHEDGSECTCEKPKVANTPEWYIFYGYGNPKGYLYNELYSEIRESNEDPWGDKITWNKETIKDEKGEVIEIIDHGADLGTYRDENGKVLWQGGDMWGVDDGWGYLPGRTYTDGLTERHGYISLYNYKFWSYFYTDIIDVLADAYLYTGDEKYGLAGAKFLDRVADVWDSLDAYYFRNMFMNTSGGSGMGAAVGRINDSYLGRTFTNAVDTFYPMITNDTLIRELSGEAELRGLENKKMSSEDIWRNWADGILIASANMCMDGRINGNYGQAQAVAAIAAIVLNEQPKTDEIIEWLYKNGKTESDRTVSGGQFEPKIINDVDRDGMGNEASPRYNTSWISNLRNFADALLKYEGERNYNPYENPKFVKMLDPQMNILLASSKHPNVGDAGDPASITLNGSTSIWYNAFTKVKNEEYKRKFAQYLYEVTDGNLASFGQSIFAENPQSAEEEIMAYVDVNKKPESTMLTGYGIGILRDGANYKSASASTAKNTHRDFWMWFGNTGASHAHQDALNIGIDAFGLDVAPDLGYPEDTSYTPNRLQWVNTTISHNTVVVDEKQQAGVSGIHGYPYHFDDSGKVKLMDADMKSVYPQTENYRRTIVMVQANDDVAYGIDFFRVTGGSHHLFSFHSQAENAYPISGIELTPDPVVQDANGKDIIGSYAGPDAPFGKDPDTKDAWEYETFYPRGYTWLKNVRRDKSPDAQFTVEFDVQDYRKVLKDGKGIKLRMTQFNNFTPTEVAIAGGYVTKKSTTKMMPDTWDYVLVERDGGEGANLDSFFTTVYEPYRNTPYIEEIKPVDITVKTGDEAEGDMARAVKVKHTEANGGNTDYIVYATNKNVVYTVMDGDFSFDFSGFVGVYTINANGGVIYRYVNDGTIIGEETGNVSAYAGKVTGFQTENAFENYIDVEIDCTDLSDLAGKYIYVDNDGVQNAAYQILSATDSAEGLKTGSVRLDVGTVTLIRGHKDKDDVDKGYIYNIKEGQSFSVPTAFVDESVPEFDEVSDNLSVSAGSSISVNIHAKTPVIGDGAPTITYIGTTLPRGASLNSETGVFTWKPDSSQVGDNHVAITARDSDGRESTIHFDIAVYGNTTGGSSSNKTETPGAETTTPSGGGGGGGGGGAAPTDKPDDETKTDETGTSDKTDEDESLLPEEKVPSAGKADEVEKTQFTDLSEHTWAADAINTLADDGIIRGTTSDTYSPANNITRADFASLLVRAFKLTSDNTENFADVSANDYFATELAIARNNGIISGIGDNKFAPRNTITRQDMMVIVYRVLTCNLVGEDLRALPPTDKPNYEDFDTVAPYAKDAVSALISAGLVNGKSGNIAPMDYTTRAEVAVLIKRILDYVK